MRSSRVSRNQEGSVLPLMIGLVLVLVMVSVVVIDATAAYLARADLRSLADEAALVGAEAGFADAAYAGRSPDSGSLAAELAARRYLSTDPEAAALSGLTVAVRTRAGRIEVELDARVRLPLRMPGIPTWVPITGTGSAVMVVRR